MRLWTIHPKYLDARGIVALWREALLAQAVLHGKTRGYKNHPQLERFRGRKGALNKYLHLICDEAEAREYNFDRSRIRPARGGPAQIMVSRGQVLYEWKHLQRKLKFRDPERLKSNGAPKSCPETFPCFVVTRKRKPEAWEIV